MKRIYIGNLYLGNGEKTFLDADYDAGDLTLTVVSNLGFGLNDIAVIAEVGDEKSEAQQVAGVTGNNEINLNVGLKFSHNKTLTVYRSIYNQVSVERAVTSVGTFAQIALIDLQWDKAETIYEDVNGSDSMSYRYRFYNSYTSTYSDYSPTIKGSGFTRFQVGTLIYNVRKKIKDPNKQRFTDQDIINTLQDGQLDIESFLPKLYFLRVDTFHLGTGIQAVGGTDTYSLDTYTDFNYLDKIKYSFVNGGTTLTYDLDMKPEIQFDRFIRNTNHRWNTDRVLRTKYILPDSLSSNGYFQVDPVPLTDASTFYPIYYRHMTPLAIVTDTTECPFPEILEDYAAWKLSEQMENEARAQNYEIIYRGFRVGYRGAIIKEDMGLTKLERYNSQKKGEIGYGRNLVNFRGRNPNNFYKNNAFNADYIRENFFDP